MKKFQNKTVIITGAARGVGLETSLSFLKDGANVVMSDIDFGKLEDLKKNLNKISDNFMLVKADISKQEDISILVKSAADRFGNIDFLVNNASTSLTKQMMALTTEDWDKVLNINVKGTFFTMIKVADNMIKNSSSGCIINISSIAAMGARPLFVPYAASKAAVINFTKSAAIELAKYGIRVNSIAPGTIDTDMWDKISKDISQINLCEKDIFKQEWIKKIPLKRLAQPKDIANTILFLCSDEGNYITGQTINVCGGLSAL